MRTEERQTLVALTGVRSALASGEPTSAFANTQDLLREGSVVNKVILPQPRVHATHHRVDGAACQVARVSPVLARA